MPKRTRIVIASAILLASLPWGRNALAQVMATNSPAQPTMVVPLNSFGVEPLDGQALANQRGGADTWNDMKLSGVVTNNQAVNVATGSNLITDGALSGAAGLPMVIQNSGNNVLIQNATIVNVQMK